MTPKFQDDKLECLIYGPLHLASFCDVMLSWRIQLYSILYYSLYWWQYIWNQAWDWPENKKTENIIWRKITLLLIKASRQSNFKQHLSLSFHHLCILHSHLFLTPFSDTYTKNISIIFEVVLCIEWRYSGACSPEKKMQFGAFKVFFS